jgi:hypothetical protein
MVLNIANGDVLLNHGKKFCWSLLREVELPTLILRDSLR